MSMLSEDEQQQVFTQRLLPRWATRTRDRINEWSAWSWKQGLIKLTWAGVADRDVSAILYLPEDVGQILSMYPDQISYREPVTILSRWEFDQTRPGNTAGRGKDYLVLWGYYRVMVDNPSDAQVVVTATGGANAEGIQVRIRGRDSTNKDMVQEVGTLDNTGSFTSTTTWLGGAGQDGVTDCTIIKDSLEGKTDPGFLEFKNGGILLERLNADVGQISRERRRTELYAQIGGGGLYNIAYFRRYPPLSSDGDTFLPEIPNEFVDVAELGIMQYICLFRKEVDLRREYELEFKQRMRELSAWDNRSPGYRPALRVSRQWGSRVGMQR